MNRQSDAAGSRTDLRARWIAGLFMLVSTVLLVRNLALDSPLMAGDEYAYQAAAQGFPHSAERFASDPYLPRIYSPVFAAYGRALFSLTDRPELLIKVLNTLAFVLAVLIYLSLVRTIAGQLRPVLAAWVLLLTPISAYTAYFMPESTYALCFAVLAWAVVRHFPARMAIGAAFAGVVVGTMLLIKPHALALFTAVPLTLAALFIAPAPLRPARGTIAASAGVFVLGSYLTLVILNLLLSGTLKLHPLTFVGDIYRPYLSSGASPGAWLDRPRALLGILAGHLIVLGALTAPAIAIAAGHVRRLYRMSLAERATTPRDRALFALICFAAVVTVTTIGMTTVFTMVAAQTSPHEHLRIHGRYYSFFLPLFFIIYLASAHTADSDERWLRAGAIAGCLIALLLLFLHARRVIYPWDYPEAFVFSSWEGRPDVGLQRIASLTVRYGAVAIAVAAYAMLAWRGRRAAVLYPALLIALFAASNIGVSAWQRVHSLQNHALRQDGVAARQLIPPGDRSAGLVVGPVWNGPLAFFLFNFQASPRVIVRDAGTRVTTTDLPPGTRWVLLIGRYVLDVPGTPSWQTPQVIFVPIGAAAGTGGQ